MNFILQRTEFGPRGIFGQLTAVDGSVTFCTLEHAYEQSDGTWAPAVPPGDYICARRTSPKFGEVFQLLNVPNHTFIEIHPGNWNKDSEGCILIGLKEGLDAILFSRLAFNQLMSLNINQFNLTVI